MKKAISLLLGISLCCGLALPAAAADTAQARLAAVTEKVKVALAMDTSMYDAFDGELEESNALPVWNLRWDGKDGALYVTATEGGKILSYSSSNTVEAVSSPGSRMGTALPKLSREEAWKTAQAFLDRVLEEGVETAQPDLNVGAGRLSIESHSFYGDVLEHGLPSPFGFRVSVDVGTNAVTSYFLTGSFEGYMGALPSPTPAAAGAEAALALKGALSLRLEYVLGVDGKTAELRYLPNDSHDYYVDGQSGALVDLTALRQELWDQGGRGDGAADAAMGNAGPSPAEQEGIARMEGVMDREALAAAAGKMSALGLSRYTLSGLSYRVDGETGDVSAVLQYARRDGERVYRRSVTLDAKTGALWAVYSSRPWDEEAQAAVTAEEAREKAEAFLKSTVPGQYAKTGLYVEPGRAEADFSGEDGAVSAFRYAQRENGYFFPESALYVEIDPSDGSVYSYSNEFIEDAGFESAEGVISGQAALDAWFGSYAVTLGYVGVPVSLDLSAPAAYLSSWQTVNTQKLGWTLVRDGWYLGVDAKTGAVLEGERSSGREIVYADLDGHWVKAKAETLAGYGVGWLGGKLEPGKALTQRDMVALLASTGGYLYDPQGGAEAADQLYDRAYSMGILTRDQRADDAALNRAETVKLLLDAMGYREVAGLGGIYRCSYQDEAEIPDGYYGYAALAQGLGVVNGGKDARFDAAGTATRAEVLSMLHAFLSR